MSANLIYQATPAEDRATKPVYRQILAEEFTDEAGRTLYEDWFRDAIANNPALVIEPCRKYALTDERWYPWATEFAVHDGEGCSVGRIDVLLLSESGRIGIVETKLAYNAEGRRKVLAQLLDYAVHLPELEVGEMPPICSEVKVSANDVAEHLSRGDFLLIIAGDQLDSRAVKLSQAILGDHMVNEWNLALVDLSLYERVAGDGPTHLIVPNVRGMLVRETRNIVRVNVSSEGLSPRVRVERVAPAPQQRGQKAIAIDWESFKAHATQKGLDQPAIAAMEKLYDACKSLQADISWGRGSVTGSFSPKWPTIHAAAAPLSVYSDGRIDLHFPAFQTSEKAKAFSASLAREIVKGSLSLPPDWTTTYPVYGAETWLPKVDSVIAALQASVREHLTAGKG